jgi:hypothetical protein
MTNRIENREESQRKALDEIVLFKGTLEQLNALDPEKQYETVKQVEYQETANRWRVDYDFSNERTLTNFIEHINGDCSDATTLRNFIGHLRNNGYAGVVEARPHIGGSNFGLFKGYKGMAVRLKAGDKK